MNNIDRLYPEAIIFSVFQKDQPEGVNQLNTAKITVKLTELGIPYKLVTGVHNGENELSFYVETGKFLSEESHKRSNLIADLANEYGQESILCLSQHRQAELLYLQGSYRYEDLGYFKQVSLAEAKQHDRYTWDSENNGYYICE